MSGTAVQFIVRGVPKPQPRPRATRRGEFAHIYTPRRAPVNDWKHAVWRSCQSHLPREKWDGPVRVSIEAYFPRPHRLGSGSACWYGSNRGDADNIAKAVIDALNPRPAVKHKQTGRVLAGPGPSFWHDDRQVVSLRVDLMYAETGSDPGVRITIERLGGEAFPALFGEAT